MMQSTSHKSVFKQYYLRCLIIFMLYISFVVLCIYVYPNIWSAVFCTILYIPVKIFIRISANKTIASVLFNDLNAQQFHQIITNNKHFLPPLSYRINAAFFTGDYQTVVNIVSCQIRKKRCSIKEKLFYLSLLARVYFELRDFDKLNLLLKKHDEIRELYPSKKLVNTANSIWSYYRYFLDGNFEACKTICREKHLELNSKAWDAKIRKLNNDFAYAVACYENGDTNDAIEYFESIISYAQNMHSSELSARYVEAIKTNSEITVFEEIVPEKNYQLYDSRTTKKIHRHRIITVILLIIVSSSIITSSVFDYMEKKKQEQHQEIYNSALAEYETKLNNALSKHYDNAIFVKYFEVRDGEQHIDTFCLIDVGYRMDLASVVTYDGEKTFDLILLVEGIEIPHDYSVKSVVSNLQIAFYISDKQLNASDYKDIIEYSHNNRNYWIGIRQISSPTN